MAGKYAKESSCADADAIAKHYGRNAKAIHFRRSGEMPFLEETSKMIGGIKRFFGITRRKKKPQAGE